MENIARLKELFPEVVAEGKVDFDALQEILGNEVETGEEFIALPGRAKHRPAVRPTSPAPAPCAPARRK